MNKSEARMVALVIGAAIFYWVTLPPSRIALNNACEPSEIMARTSAALHGASFWRAQDAALVDALQLLAAQPAAAERARDSQKGSVSAIESRMTRLSSNEAESPALQEQADLREQRERLEQMGWLTRCRDLIARRLAQ
ncbi:MAG TPA: hypothetical protein VN809_16845 [Telmatospirillum sp.]|nr:hypothetical protein [Telmatospirillum sp.]